MGIKKQGAARLALYTATMLLGSALAADKARPPVTEGTTPSATPAPAPSFDKIQSNPRNYAMKLLATCSPTSLDLVTRNASAQQSWTFSRYDDGGLVRKWTVNLGPPFDLMTFITGNRAIDILLGLPSAVHEIGHGFAHHLGLAAMDKAGQTPREDGDYRLFYVTPTRQVLVTLAPTFPSSTIASTIPEKLRLPRYQYVSNTDPQHGVEVNGIYGLLDEYVSYALDARASMDLLFCGWEGSGLSPDNWHDLIHNAETDLLTHEELGYYLLQYLNYAQQNRPEVYAALMADRGFVDSFLAVDAQFTSLQAEYDAALPELFTRLNDNGFKAELREDRFGINGVWRGRYNKQKALAKETLAASPYVELREKLSSKP